MAMELSAPAHGHAAAHHEEGLSRGMYGMVFFIASEVMLFGGLFACYFFVRNQATVWPPAGTEEELSVSTAAILTAILISSSVFAHMGIIGLKSGNRTLFRVGIAIACVLGTIFVGGQIYEWLTLMHDGLEATSNVYGST